MRKSRGESEMDKGESMLRDAAEALAAGVFSAADDLAPTEEDELAVRSAVPRVVGLMNERKRLTEALRESLKEASAMKEGNRVAAWARRVQAHIANLGAYEDAHLALVRDFVDKLLNWEATRWSSENGAMLLARVMSLASLTVSEVLHVFESVLSAPPPVPRPTAALAAWGVFAESGSLGHTARSAPSALSRLEVELRWRLAGEGLLDLCR